MIKYIRAFMHYTYLLKLLTLNEIKRRYRNSVLGVIWSLVAPLLDMVILSIVFSAFLGRGIENYAVFMLTGRLVFGFFSAGTTTGMKSVVSSAQLLKKIYVPKYILVLAKQLSSFITFLITLIALSFVMLVTKFTVTMNILYSPIYLFLLLIFVTGCSFILSTINVFFRDMEHFYSVILTGLMYLSAIFYEPIIVPEKYQILLRINPLFHYIEGFREVIYYGNPPQITNLIICLILAIVSLGLGLKIFYSKMNRFIYYL